MNDHEPNVKALRREWLGAGVFAALGLLLLAAVAVLVVMARLSVHPAPPGASTVPSVTAPDNSAARRQEDIALCDAALAVAQTMGLVPGFAARDGDVAEASNVQGRYLCRAKTDAAKYAITFDLACTHLGDGKCIVPYTIAQGGSVLYQRH